MKIKHGIYLMFALICTQKCLGDTLSFWSAEANQVYAKFGCSVSSAGDVNGDGYDDAIITAAYYDNGQTDEGRVFVYYGSSAGLSSIPSWTAESDQANANCYSGNGAGDVNGDGYDDVIVGAHQFDNGQTDEGKVFVYYGSSSGLSLTPDWSAESDQAGAVFGISVASAGDVNSDGFYDVIIGANLYDNGETDEGKVFVYYGSASGLPSVPSWTFETDQAFSYLGLSVCSAGDVNNDGYDDVITAAQYIDNGQTDEGRAYIFFGSENGLSLTPDWMTESDQAFALYGYSVWKAGDVNGDGYDDVLVGAYLYDNGQTDEGKAYLYLGSETGPSLTTAWTAEGDQANARYGISVSTAGDMNGDGYSDVIIGAYRYDSPLVDEGRAYVYLGSDSGLSETPFWTGEGDQANARYGYFVSTAGDVNNDGNDEFIIGASNYDNGEVDEGKVYVYYGKGSRSLELKMFVQGFYDASLNSMNEDTIRIFIRKSIAPFTIVDSAKSVVNNGGHGLFYFDKAVNGEGYYIEVIHRNSVSTWSSVPVVFSFGQLNYDFTQTSASAFGGNEKLLDIDPLTFGIYNGDADRNDQVNLNDIIAVFNSSAVFQTGYISTDITGDSVVNLQDLLVTFNNASDFVSAIHP